VADPEGVSDLVVTKDGPVVRLLLNRPSRKNALTVEMIGQITRAIEAAGADDDARVIVIGANGPDFCTGVDLARTGPTDAGSRPRTGHLQRSFQQGAHRMILALDGIQLPVVAGVRGWAAGIGNMLALSADVVIATPTAKFWVPFVTRGFTPDSGNTYLLPRLVGLARAKEMVMRGKPIGGEQAARWGLISEVVPEEQLDDAVAEVTAEFAAAATVAVGLAKTLIHRNLEVSLAGALQNEGMYEEVAIRSDDFKEGMRAFAERRAPGYRGR